MAQLFLLALLLIFSIAAASSSELRDARFFNRRLKGYSYGDKPSPSTPVKKPSPSSGPSGSHKSKPAPSSPSSSSPVNEPSPTPPYGSPKSSSPVTSTPPASPSYNSPPPTYGSPSSSSPVTSTPPPFSSTPVTSTPATSTPPVTSTPSRGYGHGSCRYWRSNTRKWPNFLSIVTTIGKIFGGRSGSRFGVKLTLLEAIQSDGTDGYSSLARQGTASLLNAYIVQGFALSASEVREQFNAALDSSEAAMAQATRFEQLNELV